MITNDVCKQSRRRLVWAIGEERRRNRELRVKLDAMRDEVARQRHVIGRLVALLHEALKAFAELHNWSWYSGKPEREIVDGLISLGLTWADAEGAGEER